MIEFEHLGNCPRRRAQGGEQEKTLTRGVDGSSEMGLRRTVVMSETRCAALLRREGFFWPIPAPLLLSCAAEIEKTESTQATPSFLSTIPDERSCEESPRNPSIFTLFLSSKFKASLVDGKVGADERRASGSPQASLFSLSLLRPEGKRYVEVQSADSPLCSLD